MRFKALNFGEWRGRLLEIARAAHRLSFYRLAILFALGGHVALALLMNVLNAAGVDFGSINRNAVSALQIALFALQTGLVIYVIVKAGIPPMKTSFGVAALLFAVSMLMLTFVSAQCDLYGACL